MSLYFKRPYLYFVFLMIVLFYWEVDMDWLDLNSEHKFAQDNRLVTAQYSRGISLIGQKLVRLAIANVNSMKDDDFFVYQAKLLDIARLLGVEESKHIYRDVKKASAELLETKILIEDKSKKNGSYRRYNMFSYFDYNDGSGTVTIKFNEDMKEFLLHLRRNFTQIPLEQVIFMNHKYSIKIYELIQMKLYKSENKIDGYITTPLKNVLPYGHKEVELTIEEIRRATNTENVFKQIGELKKRVLIPAFDDIEKHAHYHCNCTDIKDGRKITGFIIDFWLSSAWTIEQQKKGQIEGQMNIADYLNME